MLVEIELDDPTFCVGCPMLRQYDDEADPPHYLRCALNHWKRKSDVEMWHNSETNDYRKGIPDGFTLKYGLTDYIALRVAGWRSVMLRPDTCVLKYGA